MAKVIIVFEDINNPEKGEGVMAQMEFEPKLENIESPDDLTNAQKQALMVAEMLNEMAQESGGSVHHFGSKEEVEMHKAELNGKVGNA